jgi:hypothetical protein
MVEPASPEARMYFGDVAPEMGTQLAPELLQRFQPYE